MMQTIITMMKSAVPIYGPPRLSMNQLLTMGTGLLLGADEGLGAFRHRRRGAADRIGHVVVGDRRLERLRIGRTGLAEGFPGGRLDRVQALEALVHLIEPRSELIKVIER